MARKKLIQSLQAQQPVQPSNEEVLKLPEIQVKQRKKIAAPVFVEIAKEESPDVKPIVQHRKKIQSVIDITVPESTEKQRRAAPRKRIILDPLQQIKEENEDQQREQTLSRLIIESPIEKPHSALSSPVREITGAVTKVGLSSPKVDSIEQSVESRIEESVPTHPRYIEKPAPIITAVTERESIKNASPIKRKIEKNAITSPTKLRKGVQEKSPAKTDSSSNSSTPQKGKRKLNCTK
jgi:hypothetical protein